MADSSERLEGYDCGMATEHQTAGYKPYSRPDGRRHPT